MHEIEILKNMDHPHILRVYETYEDSKHLYIITELVKGQDLLDEISLNEGFTEADAAYIMQQILNGISYIHKNNLLHRDIKPENIMVEHYFNP